MTEPHNHVSAGSAEALIHAERRRQIEVEGWTPAHDDEHAGGEMAIAASLYYRMAQGTGITLRDDGAPFGWPWDAKWWKPKDAERNFIIAGALYQAEQDRLHRMPGSFGLKRDRGARMQPKIQMVTKALQRLLDEKYWPLAGADLARWCHDNPDLAFRMIEELRHPAQAVAWTNEAQLGFLKNPAYAEIPMAMWGKCGNYANVPLYASQPSPAATVKVEDDGSYEPIYPRPVETKVSDSLPRVCTCHPDDNPPRPCPQRFAYSECVKAHNSLSAGNDGAEEAIRDWWYSDRRQPMTSKEAAKSLIWYLAKCGLKIIRDEPQASPVTPADDLVSQIEERFPNWKSYRDLVDCIDCTLHQLRAEVRS